MTQKARRDLRIRKHHVWREVAGAVLESDEGAGEGEALPLAARKLGAARDLAGEDRVQAFSGASGKSAVHFVGAGGRHPGLGAAPSLPGQVPPPRQGRATESGAN